MRLPLKPPSLHSLFLLPDVDVIASFATLEYKEGSAEVGRALFEDVLSSYPKRIDLWERYLDQELRLGQAERLRALFDRMTALPLSLKQTKHFFKRYLLFETEHGSLERVAYVKQRAADFVTSQQ